ncbi:hypothetical protein [Acinetobacter tianfuensis]|nr:hypothetical protein [Acinetobacter tianfuensis]
MASFNDFSTVIAQQSIEQLLHTDALLLGSSDAISSYYCPFDAINTQAKVVLVGICPGKVQWKNALTSARQALKAGLTLDQILLTAKTSGAFSGPMRSNLIHMLDYAGLAQKLDIQSTAALFEPQNSLVHMTSVLRHCILINGENYNGSSPNMLKNTFLNQHIQQYFIPETAQFQNAVYIPLGKSVIDVLYHLSSLGYLKESQILDGFPHPSGANAERIKYFLGEKSANQLSAKTNAQMIDQAKNRLLDKINHINFKAST